MLDDVPVTPIDVYAFGRTLLFEYANPCPRKLTLQKNVMTALPRDVPHSKGADLLDPQLCRDCLGCSTLASSASTASTRRRLVCPRVSAASISHVAGPDSR